MTKKNTQATIKRASATSTSAAAKSTTSESTKPVKSNVHADTCFVKTVGKVSKNQMLMVNEPTRTTCTAALATESVSTKKKRQSNNLAIALGRMAHVKSKTLACMKAFDKKTRNVPISVSMHKMPSYVQLKPLTNISHQLCSLPPSNTSSDNVFLTSPLECWTPSLISKNLCSTSDQHTKTHSICKNNTVSTIEIGHLCSFCEQRIGGHINVEFNAMLSSPYVLTCMSCFGP